VYGLDVDDEFFPGTAVDVVVSLAATANPEDALKYPAGAYANSTRIMIETMEYARETGARVLHVSTNEAHPPVGPYGGAKACQEIVLSTYPDVSSTIAVTQSLFGEHQQPNKLVPTAIRNLLAGRSVPVQCTGTKFAMRPFLYVQDLAYALVALAKTDAPPQRVNLGAEMLVSAQHVVHILALALGTTPTIDPVQSGDRPGHELMVQPIGWDLDAYRPATSLTTALWTVAGWYRAHPQALGLDEEEVVASCPSGPTRSA
jgi:dTDP-glucose 4,6-dehydratase